MMLWMSLVLIALVSGALASAFWMAYKEIQRQRNNESFFREVDAGTGNNRNGVECSGIANLSLPIADIAAYDKAKRQMYQQFAEAGQPFDIHHRDHLSNNDTSSDGYPESSEEDDLDIEPWQRTIPPEAKKTLKVLLIKRAMGSIPAVRQLSCDFSAKVRLNQMQLMSQIHWEKIQKYRDDLDAEITFIRREAEALQPGWGASDQVFREAHMFYQHNAVKTEKAKQTAQQEREDKEEKDRQKRLAEKMLRGLLRQEDSEKKPQQPQKAQQQKPQPQKSQQKPEESARPQEVKAK